MLPTLLVCAFLVAMLNAVLPLVFKGDNNHKDKEEEEKQEEGKEEELEIREAR